jgi:hypothetical protein
MTASCPVPSEVEPEALADLIADAALIALPHPATVEPTAASQPPAAVVIPPVSVALVDGSADYGV